MHDLEWSQICESNQNGILPIDDYGSQQTRDWQTIVGMNQQRGSFVCLHKFFTFNFRSLMLCCCTHAGFGVPPIPDIPTFEPPLVSLKKLCSGTFMRHTHTYAAYWTLAPRQQLSFGFNFHPQTDAFVGDLLPLRIHFITSHRIIPRQLLLPARSFVGGFRHSVQKLCKSRSLICVLNVEKTGVDTGCSTFFIEQSALDTTYQNFIVLCHKFTKIIGMTGLRCTLIEVKAVLPGFEPHALEVRHSWLFISTQNQTQIWRHLKPFPFRHEIRDLDETCFSENERHAVQGQPKEPRPPVPAQELSTFACQVHVEIEHELTVIHTYSTLTVSRSIHSAISCPCE